MNFHLKFIMVILVCLFSSSIISQTEETWFDKYRKIYEDADKKSKIILNDWIEKQIFTLEEKKAHVGYFTKYKNYLDSLVDVNDVQAARDYNLTLTDDKVREYQELLYYTHYYFPVEYYYYWTELYKCFQKGDIKSTPGNYDYDLLDYIGKNISFLNYCIVEVPYILEVHVDQVLPDIYKGSKWLIIKGQILKDLKSNKTFSETKPVEFLCRSFVRRDLTSFYYDYESELAEMDINYYSIEKLRAGSDYIFYLHYILGAHTQKFNTQLHVRIGINQNAGIFEIKNEKVIDPYNFFRLGKNPSLKEVEKLLSERISEITGDN